VPQGEVRFENVSFGYGEAKRVIDNRFDGTRWRKIGLIGRLVQVLVNLLLRFHDLDAGRVLIDGQDIANVTQDSLRSHIGMVTQDTSLLHRSVRDNITYSRPTPVTPTCASCRAGRSLGIHRPADGPAGRTGFDAQVGERGVTVGRQRQRIAIARGRCRKDALDFVVGRGHRAAHPTAS
jgi:ATP-binding cassette subfamily B multidrug efflux pump